jgi:hypothetical protein
MSYQAFEHKMAKVESQTEELQQTVQPNELQGEGDGRAPFEESDFTSTTTSETNAQDTLETEAQVLDNTGIYLLKYEDGKVIVYQQDGKTVFEETSIDATHLPKDTLNSLKEGITVEGEGELYSLLESFSS